MELTMTLRSEIEKGIADMGMNFSEFGEWSGINRGIFSAILNSNPPKPISLNQMERIGRALGHEEGWMFERYIEECFYDGRPNRRRVEPFLIRCAELGRVECIQAVLSRLLEDLRQLDMIFEIAEALYEGGKVEESVVFYRCLVQNEKYHQSERLAVSHYRLFRAALGEDNEQNLRAAIEFEPFCERLPDHHRLDGLMKLFDVYFTLEKLDAAEHYSKELINFSELLYKAELHESEQGSVFLKTEYPFIVYYGYGFLSMETIYFRREDFEKARACNEIYGNLSGFKIVDERVKQEIEKFNFYAYENRIHINLLAGKEDSLKECVAFLRENPGESLASVLFILNAANKYKFVIHQILEEFWHQVERCLIESSHYKKNTKVNRYIDICYETANYYFYYREYKKGVEYVLSGLEYTIKINNKNMFMKYVPLFERYRSLASLEQQLRYKNLMEGVE